MTIDPFSHEVLHYEGLGELAERSAAFVREGLRAGEPVMVAVHGGKLAALREALGDDARDVVFADLAEIGRNPARIIPAWSAFLHEHRRGAPRLRGIGEPIWPERGPAELLECQLHESLLNVAFADTPGFRLMCPYDRSTLEAGVLHESCRSHPVVLDGPVRRPSPSFAGVQAALEPFALPLPAPTGRTTPLGFDATTVHAVRGAVARRAGVAGLTTPRTRDLQLATHEAATNSVWHGGGRGVLRTWLEDDRLVCEVRDRGHVDDPLAGRHLPDRDQLGGRGLYIANQLCDLVQLRSSAQGTVVRLHMDLAA